MPVINRIAEFADEITAWRRDFHENPELLFDVHRTAGIVAEKLKEFGCDDVVTGIAQTGVVAVIHGRTNTSGKVIGLRADMDALPIEEIGDVPYRSKTPGKMHACGHDGHTSTLLGAAKYLSETRNFDGTAVLIFQPAEEGGAGGGVMVEEGVMERFGIQEIYGMHNAPGLPVGQFAIRTGAIMASADHFTLKIEGKGGHGAAPNQCIDPIIAGAHLVTALQTIVSRNVDPLESGVVTIGCFKAGDTFNVIPQTATLLGTVRALNAEVRELLHKRIMTVVENTSSMFGTNFEIEYHKGYPVTINHPEQTAFLIEVAQEISGSAPVETDTKPLMGAEDFSYMLERRPGAYIFSGNGDSASLHHPAYNFNDEALPYAVSLWARVIEKRMPIT